jgi:hypothetical protein
MSHVRHTLAESVTSGLHGGEDYLRRAVAVVDKQDENAHW